MFARYYTYVEFPFEEVSKLLLQPSPQWLAGLDGDSGDELLARVGVRVGRIPIYKHVRLQPEHGRMLRPIKVIVPLAWKTSGGPPIFPEMHGQLEAEPFGSARTQLTLSANYEPPLGALGEAIDRALLYRLGDATLHDFMARVVDNVRLDLELQHKT
ncbi:MAG: hypothetical protein M3256_27895 [Actinomycetota bacterium]|jgi:hypothetical protein|nr:hypothetical protein [Actinomycetota bacterium]